MRVGAQHACIAIELDGESQATRGVPDRRTPRSQRDGQPGGDEQMWITRGTMLLLVTEHERAERRVEGKNPCRDDELHGPHADDRGPDISREAHRLTVDVLE